MDNIQDQLVYIATDGDNIGRQHAAAILSDDVENIRNISDSITNANEMIENFFESQGGRKISLGGDEGLFEAPTNVISLLDQLRKDYEYMIGATLSVGYGSKPSEAGKALAIAKLHGKNQVVQYDESIENELHAAQEAQGSDEDQEKRKIKEVMGENSEELPEGSDAAVNEPTQENIPKYNNNLGYDSGYKNDNEQVRDDSYREQDVTPPTIKKPNLSPKPPIKEAVSGDVPEVTRPMNEDLPYEDSKEPEIEKPAPKAYHGQAEGDEDMAPESAAQPREDKVGSLKYSPPKEGQPEPFNPEEDATSNIAEDTIAEDMGEDKHCPSCTCGAHDQPIEEVLDQHIENYKDYTNELGEGGEYGTEASTAGELPAENVLDQHIENAREMSDEMDGEGISRPDDYGQKQEDMGLSEEEADSDEPQLDQVLRDGLDAHADSIQREKVINMVGEALESFKNQKQILDKAKEQAPELYSATISMLRAMIELCSLAGIDNSEPEQEVNQIEGQQELDEDSCPNCGHPKAVSEEEPQQAPQQ